MHLIVVAGVWLFWYALVDEPPRKPISGLVVAVAAYVMARMATGWN